MNVIYIITLGIILFRTSDTFGKKVTIFLESEGHFESVIHDTLNEISPVMINGFFFPLVFIVHFEGFSKGSTTIGEFRDTVELKI